MSKSLVTITIFLLIVEFSRNELNKIDLETGDCKLVEPFRASGLLLHVADDFLKY